LNATSPAASRPPSRTGPALRLLVVDDEPDLRTLYELTLVREGYEVESAGSVEEAWPLVARTLPPTVANGKHHRCGA
jgi:two-component system, NtrC family, response regulator PilR